MMTNLIVPIILIIMVTFTKSKHFDTHDVEIDQLLKKLNKPALKSIMSPDGDIIDCVHLKNHPIYDHPLFKNHTIQMKPSSYPEKWNNESSDTEKHSILTQLWTINGKCPKNSIPIRRTTREDILRAKSIERYGKKDPNSNPHSKLANSTNTGDTHEYAILRLVGNSSRTMYYGAKADINVWQPYIQMPREFSLAQMWVMAGPPSEINTIETGWQVYPSHYGDYKTRYFVYWTRDAYRSTGCYNLDCPGFVHNNEKFALGEPSSQVSSFDGQQSAYSATIWKDTGAGHWWLKLGNQVIGYWPSSLFTHLQNAATKIDWGGEIKNSKFGSQHTTTKMGSGHFAPQGYKKASFFKNVEIADENRIWKQPTGSYPVITEQFCYNIQPGTHPSWGIFFFYGGPGRNPHCV